MREGKRQKKGDIANCTGCLINGGYQGGERKRQSV